MKKLLIVFILIATIFVCVLGSFSVESTSNDHEIRPTNTRVPQIKKKPAYMQSNYCWYFSQYEEGTL